MKQSKINFNTARKKRSSASNNPESHPPENVAEQQAVPENDPQLPEVEQQQQGEHAATSHDVVVSHGVGTVEDILLKYDEWKLKLPVNLNELHSRTRRSWLAKFNPRWKSDWPWVEEVVVDKSVVGILCSVCRSTTAQDDCQFSSVRDKTQGTFITKPYVRFGSFVEIAKQHEFGGVKIPDGGVIKFGKSILEGKVEIPKTLHIRTQLSIHTRRIHLDNTIKQQVVITNKVLDRNSMAVSMLLALLHRTIKRRDSPFSSLKDTVAFNIEVLGVDIFRCLLKNGKGISHGSISEMITAIYYLTLLGIYCEMASHLNAGEVILFGAMIDLGSKLKKTKEYAGVGIRIISCEYIVTRVIGFMKCPTKDGLTLMVKLISCFDNFNGVITTIKDMLGERFPVKLHPLPLLKAENMNSLGVDGACVSKKKMINKRVLEYNPRCLAHWCGDHRASLVAGDTLKEDDRHKESHNISLKVYDLVNASSRFSEQFEVCQVNCGDAVQFKGGKAVKLGDKPMHRWESTLKFNSKLL